MPHVNPDLVSATCYNSTFAQSVLFIQGFSSRQIIGVSGCYAAVVLAARASDGVDCVDYHPGVTALITSVDTFSPTFCGVERRA